MCTVSTFQSEPDIALQLSASLLDHYIFILETAPPSIEEITLKIILYGPHTQQSVEMLGRVAWAELCDAIERFNDLRELRVWVPEEVPSLV